MKKPVFLVLACASIMVFLGIASVPAYSEATISCPAGTYDMLDWMTLDSDLRGNFHTAGSSNPLYTILGGGKVIWTKGANGSPWDVNLFDNSYIYLWLTEYDWTNPHTFKKFANNTNMPLVPRCGKAGFPGSVIKVPNTTYQTYTDCTHYATSNLRQAINEIWGPYNISFGGMLPNNLEVLVASYRYNCDANYANCWDKEAYYFAQRYGLVQWVHYSLVNGTYVLQQKTVFNQFGVGTAAPYLPCF